MNRPPGVESAGVASRPRRRWRSALLWASGAVVALIVLLLLAVSLLLAHLDSALVRKRVQSAVHDSAGIDLTYGEASASLFSGLKLRDVAILSAPQDAAVAPALVNVGEVEVGWSLGALLGRKVREVAVRDLSVAIVDDGSGESSLDRWNARRISIAGKPPPSPPLSHALDGVLSGSRMAVERLEVSGVTLSILRTREGRVIERVRAGTLALSGHARMGGGALDAAIESGPLAFEVVGGDGRALGLRPSLRLAARGREISLALEVPVGRRDLMPSLPAGDLLQLQAAIAFEPSRSRTVVRLEKLSLVNGLATASADLDLPDGGAPIVRAAAAQAQLDKLALELRELLPKGTTLEKGALSLEVKEGAPGRETRFPGVPLVVAAGRELRLLADVRELAARDLRLREAHVSARAADAKATVELRAAGLRAGTAEVDQASLDASVVPQPDGRLAVRASLPIGRAVAGGKSARRIALGVEGLVTGAKFDGDVTLAIAEARSGALRAGDLRLKASLSGADGENAGIALDGRIASVEQAGLRASGIGLALRTRLAGGKLERTTLEAPIERVAIDQRTVAPVRLSLAVEPMALEAQDVVAQVDADAGPLNLRGRIEKHKAAVGFDLQAEAGRLGALAPKEWSQAGLSLSSKGTAQLDAMSLEQTTRLSLNNVAVRRERLDFAAKSIEVALSTRGTQRRHTFDLALRFDAPHLNARGGEGVQTVSLKGGWDFARPRAEFHLAGSGVLGLEGGLDATAEYRASAVSWRLEGKLRRLGLLGVFAPPGLDFEKLGLDAHGEGTLTSLVRRYEPGPVPRFELEPDALAAIRGGNALDVTLTGVDYRGANGLAVRLASLALQVRTQTEEDRVHGEASVELPSLSAQVAGHKVEADDIRSSLVIDTEGDQDAGAATALIALRAASIKQDAAPDYPIGDVDLRLTALADTKGALRVEEGHFENPAGGTSLELHGGVDSRPLVSGFNLREARKALARVRDWIPGRRNLLIEGQLAQKLDGLTMQGLKGRGTITVPFRVESGNLSYVRATAGMRFEEVDVALPALSVEALNGFVPVTQDFLLDEKGGVTPVFGATSSPWSRLRFADQQPFTSGSPFVTARKVASASGIALGPLAGNVRIDRNIVAIDQLEAELPRGGKVTGQVLVDWQGDDTQVGFRGAVTGLLTEGSDERLDANAAVTLKPLRRLLDGRIELVRLGRSHLKTLLDLYDPYQADVAANRVRLALKFGYPKRVRLGFENGFASLAVELGGLAGAVRIDEMRGTPIGPVLERYLASNLPKKEEQP